MNNLIEDLKKIKVISTKDILNLKLYIDKKYTEFDHRKKADILSKTIHDILDKFTKELTDNNSLNVNKEILKNNIFKGQDVLYLYDVLKVYLKLNVSIDKEFVEKLTNWINKYLEYTVNIENVIEFLYKERHISLLEKEEIKKDIIKEKDRLKNIQIKKGDYKDREKILLESEKEISCTKEILNNERDFKNNITSCNIKVYNQVKKIKKFKSILLNKKKVSFNIAICAILLLPFIHSVRISKKSKNLLKEERIINLENINFKSIKVGGKMVGKSISPNIPKELKYKEINIEKLNKFLIKKDSILSEEPYFSSIIISAKEFDLNPILLFAITGQEQNFVPKNLNNAKKIANNPFNVFHSWHEYNTDIKDSSEIAARTVVNLCSDMPKGENVFKWINKKYAEDKEWWKGVEYFFQVISKEN